VEQYRVRREKAVVRRFDYVIVGGSAGAVGCIEALRAVDREKTIALICEEGDRIYSRALIPYYLGDKIHGDKMLYRPPDFCEKMGVTPWPRRRAVGLDPVSKTVVLDGGEEVQYGKLLLTTGGRPIVPPVPGLDKKNVFTFVSMADALALAETLPTARAAVLLGGGVIGLMAAETLKRRGLAVTVVELAPRVLAPVVDETASTMVEELFRAKGVPVHTGTTIAQVLGHERAEGVVLTSGEPVRCDLVVVAVGVVPRVELARAAGIAVNRGILVNEKMETSAPDVYACGDCAEGYDFVIEGNRPLPLWPNAYVGGRVAGFNMAGVPREYRWATSMNAMHFFDLYIINAGLNVTRETADGFEIVSRYEREARAYRKFALRDGRIAGFVLVGRVARAGIFLRLMREKVDVSSFKHELLDEHFGYASMPERLRWELLAQDVRLGVV